MLAASDMPRLTWAKEVREHAELRGSNASAEPPAAVRPFDRDAACTRLQASRTQVPPLAELDDAGRIFWFHAATELDTDTEAILDGLQALDVTSRPSAMVVEKRFAALFAASRWDVPRPHQVVPLLTWLLPWDETVRVILEAGDGHRHWLDDMLDALPTAGDAHATDAERARGEERLVAFVDAQEDAGRREVGAALRLVRHPEGVMRFFAGCKRRHGRWVAGQYGGALLDQLPSAKEAYKAIKRFKLTLPPGRMRALIERYGFASVDLLIEAAAKDPVELQRVMGIRSARAVPGWLRLLESPKHADFAEHFLMHEGANATSGLIKVAGGRGRKRDLALQMLQQLARAGHEALIRALSAEESKKVRELVEARVFDGEGDIPPLPRVDWPAWARSVADVRRDSVVWLRPAQLPVVRTAAGAYRWPEEVLIGLVSCFSLGDRKTMNAAKNAMHPEDHPRLAWAFFERWFAAGADKVHLWVIGLLERLGGAREAAELGALLRSPKWGHAGRERAMKALARMELPESLSALWRVHTRWRSARILLEEVRGRWACSTEEFRDRLVSECGLNALHCLELDFGARKPIAALLPPSRLVIVDRESGDVFQKLPPRRQADDPQRYKGAREQYRSLRKRLAVELEEQVPRLEEAMVRDRRFARDHWLQHLCWHAVMGPLVCTLIWKTRRPDGGWDTFLPTHPDDTCIDVHYDEVRLGAEIALAHPADLEDDTKAAWAEVLRDGEIVQPFDQLSRLALRAGSAAADNALERLTSELQSDVDLRNCLLGRGWRRSDTEDNRHTYFVRAIAPGFHAILDVDPPVPGWSWPPSPARHRITGLRFERDLQPIAHHELSPVLFSETLRNLILPAK